jgi:hypothetical protein
MIGTLVSSHVTWNQCTNPGEFTWLQRYGHLIETFRVLLGLDVQLHSSWHCCQFNHDRLPFASITLLTRADFPSQISHS